MAAGDVTYGTKTALANTSRLNSLADGQARTFGEVVNSTTAGLDYDIRFQITAGATSDGVVDIFMVESMDGSEWTDSIDPTTDTGNVAAQIDAAKLIHTQNLGNNEVLEAHVKLGKFTSFPSEFFGFVVRNNTGAAFSSTGNDGDSQSIKIAAS